MPRRIHLIHRIPRTIPIRIHPTFPKRAQAVRAVEPHQHRIERPIAIAQQIMPGHRVKPFAIEPWQGQRRMQRMAQAVRQIGKSLWLPCTQGMYHRTWHVSGEQHPFTLA
ncbi:hypothetical protein ASF84_21610 [Pseudomonas sp. Leaf127]|nr:hypothetical protein ASF84_21610 [Pseudomonas sp. Leaf127]